MPFLAMVNGLVFRWILDVAPLWPSSSENDERNLTKHDWANLETSKAALRFLSSADREKVLKFYFASDAKLALGSSLLKRKAVSDTCRVPWFDVVIGQDDNKKPCFKSEQQPLGRSLEFNVSHHGSLVALVGCSESSLQLGVDIVKMDFEKDYRQVKEKGFSDWASTYESVFSDREMEDIKRFMAEPGLVGQQSQDTIRAQLRHFYALWCLKEATLKMTSFGLLAPWLRNLEFRNVQAPSPGVQLDDGGDGWGQTSRGVEVWLNGKQWTDISLEIQAYREDYMIATAASIPFASFASFELLDCERDVFPRAFPESRPQCG